jgi:hypothetical protein
MPEAYKDHQDYSTQEISPMRKRALANLLMTPIFLIGLGSLAYVIWQISILWTIENNVTRKAILGVIGLVLFIVEVLFAYLTLKFIKWVKKGLLQKSTKNAGSRK